MMKKRAVFLASGLATLWTISGFSQVRAAQNRFAQPVVINGQTVNGAYVSAPGGQMQSFTCPAPQHYVTSDGASQGWACYEEATGVWLLNALPPATAQSAPVPVPSPQPPAVIYQQAPPPAVVYQAPPTVIYQQPQPTIVYQAPPTVVYTSPAPVIYTSPAPVVVAPAYPSSVILGTAAIRAAGQIASAAIINSHRGYYYTYDRGHGRGRRW